MPDATPFEGTPREPASAGPLARGMNQQPGDDLLWTNLKTLPAFRALLRAVEGRYFRQLDLEPPVLDLGCGDGHFARTTFDRPLAAGVDPWWGPLNKAKRTGAYRIVVQARGDRMPFADGTFATAISNSVLEHIADVDAVLGEAQRVLRPGGRLVFTVPNDRFTAWLAGAQLLERAGLRGAADGYRRWFNRVARHEHTDPPEIWAARLGQAGFAVERWQYYFSEAATHALEIGHVQGLPAALLHFLTGHWILAPWEGNLRPVERWLRPLYEETAPVPGSMLLFIARKATADSPKPVLPASEPIHLPAQPSGSVPASIAEPAAAVLAGAAPTVSLSTTARLAPLPENTLAAATVGLALLGAVAGQVVLRSPSTDPWWALPWLGLMVIGLALHRFWLPEPAAPRILAPSTAAGGRRGWWLAPAVALALLAAAVGGPGGVRPILALALWAAGSGLVVFALARPAGRPVSPGRRSDIRIRLLAAAIVLVAFGLRFVDLSEHPFILSGTEASLSLDARAFADGANGSPFSTGWLTNPTLPLVFQAAGIRLLGPSVLGSRIVAPYVGLLLVALTYAFGRRLLGRAAALLTAVLMAGSQLALHYSRLGMTNIWEPLAMLAGLGLIALALREGRRSLWLAAGLLLGLSAYTYGGAHLLPFILGGLAAGAILAPGVVRGQRRHALAALALLLVVALPQIVHYLGEPAVFADRANSQGIIQTGWLAAESLATGRPEPLVLLDQLWAGFLAYNHGPDRSPAFNAGRPLLGFLAATALLLGLGLAITRPRRPLHWLLLVWFGTSAVFAGALLLSPPQSHRLLIALPAAIMLIAIAADFLLGQVRRFRPVNRRAAVALALATGVLLVIGDLGFYFGTFRSQHLYADRNTEIAHRLAGYLNTLDGDWTVYFHGPPAMYADFPSLPYLLEGWQEEVRLIDVVEALDAEAAPAGRRVAHVFLPERSTEIGSLQERHPAAELVVMDLHHTGAQLYVLTLPE